MLCFSLECICSSCKIKLVDKCMTCFAGFKRFTGLAKHPERSLDPVAVVDIMNVYCLHLFNLTVIYQVNKGSKIAHADLLNLIWRLDLESLKERPVKDVFFIVLGTEIAWVLTLQIVWTTIFQVSLETQQSLLLGERPESNSALTQAWGLC